MKNLVRGRFLKKNQSPERLLENKQLRADKGLDKERNLGREEERNREMDRREATQDIDQDDPPLTVADQALLNEEKWVLNPEEIKVNQKIDLDLVQDKGEGLTKGVDI